MSFPRGPGGACHPFNVQKFALSLECLPLWQNATNGQALENWVPQVYALHQLAVQTHNCSTVRACGLGMFFLNICVLLTPGYDGMAPYDHWRITFWSQLQQRLLRLARHHRLRYRRRLAREARAETAPELSPRAEDVTIGIHADRKSVEGAWRGNLNAWKAFAEQQGHRFILDHETHFSGEVFARYLGLYWCSASQRHNNFWLKYDWLRPRDVVPVGLKPIPVGSFLEANLDDLILEKLRIFSQPPSHWDSLDALAAAVTKSPWTVWIDYDLTISPCCFDRFSFTQLIGRTAGGLPHVVLRDTPQEDYHHHCANSGFLIVRNSAVGKLYLDMALDKKSWTIPYNDQAALAESLLELLGLEADAAGDKSRSYRSECLHHLVLGRPMGDQSYANYCQCWRAQLDRLVGPKRDGSRWVHFLMPRQGPETNFLLVSTFLYRATFVGRYRGVGWLPLQSWSRAQHHRYVDAWMPSELGGPCGLLPLMLHWASLPYKPALLYDFLSGRFQSLPKALLMNGSVADLKHGFLLAAEEGRQKWRSFQRLRGQAMGSAWQMPASSLQADVQQELEDGACTIGSHRLWAFGGWTESKQQ